MVAYSANEGPTLERTQKALDRRTPRRLKKINISKRGKSHPEAGACDVEKEGTSRGNIRTEDDILAWILAER